jgi:hypothetical protein
LGPLGERDRPTAALTTAAGLDRPAQRAEVADRAHGIDPVLVEHRDSGAVVAAIFELL